MATNDPVSLYSLVAILKTLKPRQNGRHFADDILKCTFLNENVWISIKRLKFVPKGRIKNTPAFFQKWLGTDQWRLVYWRIYASLGLNEINGSVCLELESAAGRVVLLQQYIWTQWSSRREVSWSYVVDFCDFRPWIGFIEFPQSPIYDAFYSVWPPPSFFNKENDSGHAD